MSQQTASTVRHLTLQQWVTKYGKDPAASFYVLNRTAPLRANVDFTVMQDNGRPQGMRVPATGIPIDLGTQCVVRNLIESDVLRRVLQAGALRICDTESVIAMFKNHAPARDEYKKLFGISWEDAHSMDDSIIAGQEESLEDEAQRADKASMEFGSEHSSNPAVNALIDNSLAGDDSDSIISAIINQMDLLTKADIRIIRDRVSDSAVKEWCATNEVDFPE